MFSPCYFITCIGRPFVTNQNSCHTLSFHGRLWDEGAEFDPSHGLGYITNLVLFRYPLAAAPMTAPSTFVTAVAIRGIHAVRAVPGARLAASPLLHNNNDNRQHGVRLIHLHEQPQTNDSCTNTLNHTHSTATQRASSGSLTLPCCSCPAPPRRRPPSPCARRQR